ncbi:MAG: type III-A CRISPR-associated RAMP protein Csm5 [Sulfurospirillum sp.]|nr:type III-A CRISPR-associated RAMP protein Csm5 [Sulfurospirillum sp.]
MQKLNTFYLKLTTVSPMHIGTGDSYEPTNYVIDEGKLYGFDAMLFYHSLSDLDKKSFDMKLHDWMQIIDFYKEHKTTAKNIARFECQVTKKVEEKYSTKVNKDGKKNTNQLEIFTTFKNPNTHLPIIPGSSIKGMLDTILEIYPPKSSNEIRQTLIVSDALMIDGAMQIGYCYRKHKNPDKESKNSIPQILEVIQPKSTFFLTIKSIFSIEEIKDKLSRYHAQRKESKYMQKGDFFVFRVGKYNGKDFMVDSIRDAKNSYEKEIATHTLYEGELPFGWLSAQILEDEEYNKFAKEISQKQNLTLENIKNKEEKIITFLDNKRKEYMSRIEEKEKRAKEEAEQKLKLETEEKKRLDALNPFDRIVDELIKNNPDPNASLSVVVYTGFKEGKFDEFKLKAIQYIKEKMIEEKSWDNPKKKSAYKRTQEITDLLISLQG